MGVPHIDSRFHRPRVNSASTLVLCAGCRPDLVGVRTTRAIHTCSAPPRTTNGSGFDCDHFLNAVGGRRPGRSTSGVVDGRFVPWLTSLPSLTEPPRPV